MRLTPTRDVSGLIASQARSTLVLRLGRDPLPQACTVCGSHLLEIDEPQGPDRYGLLGCVACGCELAYLTPRLRTSFAAPSPPPPGPTPDLWRLPGCGRWCREDWHDPSDHELHGQRRLLAAMRRDGPLGPSVPEGIVRTGGLVIDPEAGRLTSDGVEVPLADASWRLLLYLAANLGELKSSRQIVLAAWDVETARAWAISTHWHASWHTLRVYVHRLRARLGPNRHLLSTIKGRGYRLEAVQETSL